jgi:hypothetical protein
MRTISVDFDGVIHTYEKGWQDGSIYGEFVDGAVAALTGLMHDHAVVIHTVRKPKQVARWLEEKSGHGLECTTRVPRSGFWNTKGVLLVTQRKIPSFAYIDDRAITFRKWSQALTALSMKLREAEKVKEGAA